MSGSLLLVGGSVTLPSPSRPHALIRTISVFANAVLYVGNLTTLPFPHPSSAPRPFSLPHPSYFPHHLPSLPLSPSCLPHLHYQLLLLLTSPPLAHHRHLPPSPLSLASRPPSSPFPLPRACDLSPTGRQTFPPRTGSDRDKGVIAAGVVISADRDQGTTILLGGQGRRTHVN